MGHGLRITAGAFKGRVLKTAEGPGYRPATALVREALFSMLEARGCVFSETMALDLFAGSGSLGFEALSRGAKAAWFVENDARAAALIKKKRGHAWFGRRAGGRVTKGFVYVAAPPPGVGRARFWGRFCRSAIRQGVFATQHKTIGAVWLDQARRARGRRSGSFVTSGFH